MLWSISQFFPVSATFGLLLPALSSPFSCLFSPGLPPSCPTALGLCYGPWTRSARWSMHWVYGQGPQGGPCTGSMDKVHEVVHAWYGPWTRSMRWSLHWVHGMVHGQGPRGGPCTGSIDKVHKVVHALGTWYGPWTRSTSWSMHWVHGVVHRQGPWGGPMPWSTEVAHGPVSMFCIPTSPLVYILKRVWLYLKWFQLGMWAWDSMTCFVKCLVFSSIQFPCSQVQWNVWINHEHCYIMFYRLMKQFNGTLALQLADDLERRFYFLFNQVTFIISKCCDNLWGYVLGLWGLQKLSNERMKENNKANKTEYAISYKQYQYQPNPWWRNKWIWKQIPIDAQLRCETLKQMLHLCLFYVRICHTLIHTPITLVTCMTVCPQWFL